MKKLTIKALEEMLEKTYFLKNFLGVHKLPCKDEQQQVFMVSYNRYQVEMDIRYDTKYVYLQICGSIDGFDAKEFIELKENLMRSMRND